MSPQQQALIEAQESLQVRKVTKHVVFDGDAAKAALSTALTGTNNDLDYTADANGIAGNDITIAYINPGTASAALAIGVSGKAITVSLATGAGTNEQQTLTVLGGGGSFTLSYKSRQTHPIAYDAAASVVQSALESIMGAGNVSVSKSTNVYTLTFIGALAATNVDMLTTNANELKPFATPTAVVATSVAGDDDPATDEQQTVTIANAAGGIFRLTYAGQQTSELPYGASAAVVEAALKALSNIGASDVSVGKVGNVYTVTFQGTLAATNVAQMTAQSALVGVKSVTAAQSVASVAPVITTTAAQIITAIGADAAAAALVDVANKAANDGTGVVTALAATHLAGGKDGIGSNSAPNNLFKALSGISLVAIVAYPTVSLNDGASLKVGHDDDDDALIPATSSNGIDATRMVDSTGLVAVGTAPATTPKIPLLTGKFIKQATTTADVDTGEITYVCYYLPIDANARVVAQ